MLLQSSARSVRLSSALSQLVFRRHCGICNSQFAAVTRTESALAGQLPSATAHFQTPTRVVARHPSSVPAAASAASFTALSAESVSPAVQKRSFYKVSAEEMDKKMKACVFVKPGEVALVEKPVPTPGAGEAIVKMTTTTICGSDVHILKGEFPVQPGLTIGHELVGTIHALGTGVEGYKVGQRVIVGAITPCGQCYNCLNNNKSQCGNKAAGGWKFGNTIDGAQAEYVRVPFAAANMAPVPSTLTDEQVLMCPDIMSTGFGGAESANIQIGDSVVVFAQGPIGLCATLGAKLRGAAMIIAVDANEGRLEMAKKLGATHTVNFNTENPVEAVKRLTNNQGVDASIEALGTQGTFESCLRCTKPGGTVSSLGVYSGKISMPLDAFCAGLGDQKIITTLCPGGKERMRRLMSVVESGRADLRPLVTHRFKLDQIVQAYDMFAHQRDGVLKVAITPN